MSKKANPVDYHTVHVNVSFSQEEGIVRVYKAYYDSDSNVLFSEPHEFNLKAMPLNVALQLASALVQNVGLVDFVDDEQ